jgi:signal transduction histidine kinase/DNA-binding response OmpR family regulator/serine phosphatase RsbU (regulator of sigma subunit)/anti-sigma regulatory factor (Ser/Thr protein kinase)
VAQARRHAQGSLEELLFGLGDLGRDTLAVDWSSTPLGPVASWPQSLQTAVRILVTSRFSMWLAWGPELTFLCNDSYRRDTLGKKYPWALGRPAREVWAEIWPDIGPRIESVLRTGEATWDASLLLFLERSGYAEETYHTFSYSPLTDDEGRVAGMLCVVTEETDRVIGERQMATLRDLGAGLTLAGSEHEVFVAVARHLGADDRSLPFTLTYLFDDEGTTAHLACATGIPVGHPAAPAALPLRGGDAGSPWPADALTSGTATVLHPPGELPTGAWTEPPIQALLVPLAQQGAPRPYGSLIVGLNRYRPLDEGYRGFVDLIAGQIAAGITNARAYESERQRAESLAELDRAKTAFFTNISHEFRTPLTLLLGPAEDALADPDEPLPPGQRARVEVVHRNAQRLLRLVNALLDFSRLESGHVAARLEPIDLPRYTADLASMFRPAVERAGLALAVECPPLPRPVPVDPEMWAKIVLNLLSNALKFTFSGTITVAVGPAADDTVELSVADTGIGIAPADQARLFERFHRVVGARSRSHEGSGIGLALVAELAEVHGGTVELTSTPGRGSTFRVRVPAGAVPAGEPAPVVPAGASQHAAGFLADAMRWTPEHPAAPGPTGPAPDGGARRDAPTVLVVDDNADMRDYVVSLLDDTYTVRVAGDGQEALDLVRVHPPDLVLTDVMMPHLDGLELLAALRGDPATADIPVVMLSARAGEEATVEGLEAGADDYLVKPFSARELLARVRANLELDRVRRRRDELERNRQLLDQAQRLAGVGSWEVDLASGLMVASDEFLRQVQLTPDDLRDGIAASFDRRVHPDDVDVVRDAVRAAVGGAPLDYTVRLVLDDGSIREFRTLGELVRAPDGTPSKLRGSNQDVTEQRQAQLALASAAAAQEAAAQEHRIADELQLSLLPERTFDPEHLDVATYYRAGVQGTQVGGDWYDLIELGADRTALIMGDVMGRGVQAAAVMGQLRAAVRAYARLDLPPADILEFLDGVVRDLGDDQIVTCVYAVYDPGDRSLAYANAGHLPPLLVVPGQPTRRLTGAAGPPLGTGPVSLVEERIPLPPGATLVLYTDGLVEHADVDIDTGIDRLTHELARRSDDLAEVPAQLVTALLPQGPDDDIAVLLARVSHEALRTTAAVWQIEQEERAVHQTRGSVVRTLRDWSVPDALAADIVLLVTELVTNAVLHGRPPIQLRLRRTTSHIVVEVDDSATFLPRKLRPTPEDEHGRGLQLVSLLAHRWGTRPTVSGKSVWCVFPLT